MTTRDADGESMDAIAEQLSGRTWSPDTLEAIAVLVRSTGREVAEPEAFDDTPEWDACENCMGTGGERDEYGEGQCGACAGAGRFPANEAARQFRRDREAEQRAALERIARLEDHDYEPDDDDPEDGDPRLSSSFVAPDESPAYRQQMRDAGRGHLLR